MLENKEVFKTHTLRRHVVKGTEPDDFFQTVQYGRRKSCNMRVEKLDKHCLSLVTKINILSDKPC